MLKGWMTVDFIKHVKRAQEKLEEAIFEIQEAMYEVNDDRDEDDVGGELSQIEDYLDGYKDKLEKIISEDEEHHASGWSFYYGQNV